jgi:hypothetical protein
LAAGVLVTVVVTVVWDAARFSVVVAPQAVASAVAAMRPAQAFRAGWNLVITPPTRPRSPRDGIVVARAPTVRATHAYQVFITLRDG